MVIKSISVIKTQVLNHQEGMGEPTDRVIKFLRAINTQVRGCQEMMTSFLEQGNVRAQGALSIKIEQQQALIGT